MTRARTTSSLTRN
jgi:hypothetical protein